MNDHLYDFLRGLVMTILLAGASAQAAQFTPLTPLPAPEIASSATPYPGVTSTSAACSMAI